MKIKIDEGAFAPVRGHTTDGGLDLRTPRDVIVPAGGSAVIDTGTHAEIKAGLVGILMSKSGLNVKHNLTSTGVIDAGYCGSIVAKLYNHGDKDYHFKAGDKITQLVIFPVYIPSELEIVESVDELYGGATERGSDGFGSTGK